MIIEGVALIIGGALSIFMGYLAVFQEGFAETYINKSVKGMIWKKILGEERAVGAMKRVFGPLGIVLGLLAFGFGIYLLNRPAG
jgi:hypothetical protein